MQQTKEKQGTQPHPLPLPPPPHTHTPPLSAAVIAKQPLGKHTYPNI